MSISLSIFQKPCPGCASSVATSVVRCDCGHIFESAANSLSPLEATLRDEELYEGYLAARAEQARQAAYTAEEALADDTSNAELVAASALAQEVAKSIENDLAEQQNKIAAIRNALRALKPAAPVAPPAVTKPSTVTKKSASHRPPVTPSAPARPAPAATASPGPVDLEKTLPAAAPAKPVPVSVWRATTTQKAAGVLAALKNAKAREAIARAQQAKATAETEQLSAPATASTHGATPPSAFRMEQASRADKIMEARKTVDGKECPNCTSSVPINTTRCRCGFAFVSDSTELPSLTLCTGDFTALRDSLKLNLR
jgi:hypothetical protein